MKDRLLLTGIGGTVLAALCCFTPLLPFALSGLGLTGLLAVVNRDIVVFPALFFFLLLTGFGLWRQQRNR